MTDKERVKELKDSVKRLAALAGYYRIRSDDAWLSEARKRRDEAIERAHEEFKEAEEDHIHAKEELEPTERQLRINSKQLKYLTSGRKVQQLIELKKKIAALQILVEKMEE